MTEPDVFSSRESAVEIDGKRYRCWTRLKNGEAEHTLLGPEALNWHTKKVEAIRQARLLGGLQEVPPSTTPAETPKQAQSEEFEVWLLGLVGEIKTLQAGERLVITRTDIHTVILRESAVLVCRSSVIGDVDLTMTNEKEKPDGGS